MILRKVEWFKEFVITQMNHWVVIMVVITVMRLANCEEPRLFLWLCVGIVPLLLYAVRYRVKQFFLFYVIHLLFPGICIMLPLQDSVTKKLLLILVIGYTMLSIYHKMHSPESLDRCVSPVVACGIGFAAYILYHYQSDIGWNSYYILAILCYMSMYFINYFLKRYQCFLLFNKESAANIPEKAILHSGLRQTVSFVLLVVISTLVLSNLQWLEFLLSCLRSVLVAIVRLLFSGLKPTKADKIDTVEETFGGGGGFMLPEAGETALIWKILDSVLMFLFAVGIVVGVVLVLVKGFAYLRNHFSKRTVFGEMQTEDSRDIRESCVIEKAEKTGRKLFVFLDNRERIRRIFKKRIVQAFRQQKGKKELKVLNYYTAKECCQLTEDEELLQIYEKARYSEEVCTAGDVKLVKKGTS